MKNFILFLLLIGASVIFAQPKSAFNGLSISNDSIKNYSFLVSGHFYGGSDNKSGYPANTLLGNLDWINSTDNEMLVCLGDLFMDVKNDPEKYSKSFFSKLELPLFNTPGNHDISGNVYQEQFGETSYYFELGADFHLFLDTEENNGDISSEQLELLKQIQLEATNRSQSNLFVYFHRTIWKDHYPEMDELFLDNTQSLARPNFEEKVAPILEDIAKTCSVYCFSGSIGGEAPSSFFYHKDPKDDITYIATAIRALPRDAMLEVIVNEGEVSFKTHSLTGQDLEPLEHYNVEFWNSTSGVEPYNWRLVPLYFQQMLTHRYFWYGFMWTSGGFICLILIIRRRKKASKLA